MKGVKASQPDAFRRLVEEQQRTIFCIIQISVKPLPSGSQYKTGMVSKESQQLFFFLIMLMKPLIIWVRGE